MKKYLLITTLLSCSLPTLFAAPEDQKQPLSLYESVKKHAAVAKTALKQLYNTEYGWNEDTARFFREVFLAPVIGNNFDVVEEGKCFRSAQPNPKTFARYIDTYNIATSINLRDDIAKIPQWEQLRNIADENDVELINIKMKSTALPDPEAVHQLLTIFNDPSKEPIHMNCHHGRDRTSFAAALYVFEKEYTTGALLEKAQTKALKEFDFLRHGHFEELKPLMKKAFITWTKIRADHDIDTALDEYETFYNKQIAQ